MLKNKISFFSIIFLLLQQSISAAPSHIVTLFVANDPLTLKTKKNNLNVGIFFSYFGYKTYTNNDGQVTFPLKTEKPQLYILVTNDIEPIFMLYNTISHLEVKNQGKYTLYSFEKIFDDKTQTYLWSVQQTEFKNEPIVPLNTIIVHANPEAITIKTGVTPIKGDWAQLVLPNLYVKSKIELSKNALTFLDSCQFFRGIKQTYKTTKSSTEKEIVQSNLQPFGAKK